MLPSIERRTLPVRGAVLPAFPHLRANQLPRPVIWVLLALVALAGGAAIGWLTVSSSPVKALALLVGLVWFVVALSDVRAGIWAVVGVVALLPFAVVPFHFKLTLTLLEITLLSVYAVWIVRLALHHDELLEGGAEGSLVILLLAVTLFAFLVGIGNQYTLETFHNYGKFVLAVLIFFAIWNTTRTLVDVRRLLIVLLGASGAAAALGLVLYAGGANLTLRVLTHLIPYGYPSDRIVRYVDDNPAMAMRLTSTSVDPNSFGGLLAVVFVIAVALLLSKDRIVSRWLTVPVAGATGLAMLLTQSRGAWVGAFAGLAVLTVLRFRWLIFPGAAMVVIVFAAGLGEHFIHRFYLGITLQDPATKLRLQEYRNALAIIRAHPFFGVGFGQAPSITEQTGVSDIYLTIAERAGLIALAIFLIAVIAIGLTGFRYWRRRRDTPAGEVQLGLFAALITMLAVGVFDHYFFNTDFPHMAALFWLVCGLIMCLASLDRRAEKADKSAQAIAGR